MKQIQTKDFPDTFYAYIEIQSGSSTKYEYNEDLEALAVDRFLFTSMSYPANYGFVVNTKGKDGDPIDVLVLSQPIANGAVIKCRPIGVLEMSDEEGIDHKLLAVPVEKVDINSTGINDISDITQAAKDKIKHFFEHYKELEKGKFVKVENFKNKAEAKKILKEGQKK
ncbi:MAG: inorganic diphosphatase [Candidatus Micrarchaeota archaeon]|nr:inorganic diphosphatase [Candidatus Micrarchaeota archaeon]